MFKTATQNIPPGKGFIAGISAIRYRLNCQCGHKISSNQGDQLTHCECGHSLTISANYTHLNHCCGVSSFSIPSFSRSSLIQDLYLNSVKLLSLVHRLPWQAVFFVFFLSMMKHLLPPALTACGRWKRLLQINRRQLTHHPAR